MPAFLTTVTPGYSGPRERTVQRSMKRLYSEKMFELREQLKLVDSVALTLDLWKRKFSHHHYLCITVHYVDDAFNNVSKILSFRRFHGRHLAKRIRTHLTRIIKM
jgi:hypothetical protein